MHDAMNIGRTHDLKFVGKVRIQAFGPKYARRCHTLDYPHFIFYLSPDRYEAEIPPASQRQRVSSRSTGIRTIIELLE